jgi:outer membrane protein, heavy metal efflux system
MHRKRLQVIGVLGLLLAGAASPLETMGQASSESETLSLDEVYAWLQDANPSLLAANKVANAADARIARAGTLPDPQLRFGFMNLAFPELSDNMAASMSPAIQLGQSFPFPGKLSSAERIASLGAETLYSQVDALWWDLRASAAQYFFNLYAIDGQFASTTRSLRLVEDFGSQARAMYSAGTGRQSDVLRATVESARLSGELARLTAMREGAAARLNALLDRPANTFVARPVLPVLPRRPETDIDVDALRAMADTTSPRLEASKTSLRQADEALVLARRQIWPDFTVGLQYGQRDRGTGIERMAGIMFGVTLPVFASQRQLPMRTEAIASIDAASARLSAVEATVGAAIESAAADARRSDRLIDLYETEVLPQARANVQSALASYRVGEVDFSTLIDAQLDLLRFEGDLFRFEADLGQAWSKLEAATGQTLSATNNNEEDGS